MFFIPSAEIYRGTENLIYIKIHPQRSALLTFEEAENIYIQIGKILKEAFQQDVEERSIKPCSVCFNTCADQLANYCPNCGRKLPTS